MPADHLAADLSVTDRFMVIAELTKAAALTPEEFEDRFAMYLDEVVRSMGNYAERLGDGEIGPLAFKDYMVRTMRRSFADAYRYGLGASGERAILTDVDLMAVRGYLVEDAGYLDSFVRQFREGYVPVTAEDRAPGKGRFLLKDRAEMYAHAVRELYYAGYVARGATQQQYAWILGQAEHCDPCIDMANGSPYTKEQLAGRAPGPSVCSGLTRCLCSLVKQRFSVTGGTSGVA